MVVLAAGFGAVGSCLVRTHEPTYGGRRLSAWLRDFDSEKMEKRIGAADAVNHIGPNAVPFLVERLKVPRPGRESKLEQWKRRALEWLDKHSAITVSPGWRSSPRHQAVAGLDALGPAAKDALPALEKLLRENPPDPQVLYVVARIGPAGLPVLTKALSNEAHVLRLEARVCLEMIKTHSEALYGDVGSGADAASFDRRICAFNVKVLHAAYEDYRAQYPDQALPRSFDESRPSGHD